jgi:hypothetical protein
MFYIVPLEYTSAQFYNTQQSSTLKRGKHSLSTRDGDTSAVLDLGILDDKVIDDEGIAASTSAEAETREVESEAELLRKLSVGIGESKDLPTDVREGYT